MPEDLTPVNPVPVIPWTAEEEALIGAARGYFIAIAKCEEAKGRTQEALMAAMPAEIREQMPMLAAMGL